MTDGAVVVAGGRVWSAPRTLSHRLLWLASGTGVLWVMLWLAIDTGPWDIAGFSGWQGATNAARAALPLVVLGMTLLWAALHAHRLRMPTLAEGGMWVYGVLLLVMSVRVPAPWFTQGYWALSFVAVLALTQVALSSEEPLESARRLNWASWLLATAALAVMLVFARQSLLASSGLTAYGIQNRVTEIGGIPFSRPSGLSRLAVAPAILGLMYMLQGRRWIRVAAALTFVGAVVVIWLMQSRGSLFAFVGAFVFVLVFGGRGARRLGILLGIATVVLVTLDSGGGGVFQSAWEHATRNTGLAGFQTMSGRPAIWHHAWRFILKSPWLGFGPRADRWLGVGDAQNAIVYALLSTGIIGTLAFLTALVATWHALVYVFRRRMWLPSKDRTLVVVAGALLTFLTLRSVPEDGATYFSVDLLLQLPVMAYFSALHRKLRYVVPARDNGSDPTASVA